jgi:hypothetical protein
MPGADHIQGLFSVIDSAKAAGKQMKRDHLFQPGTSGNPKGRKPGQTPGAQIRKAIEERKDDILQAVINAAVNGDMTACKMLLDRITPSLKPVAAQIALVVPEGAGLSEQGAAVLKSALSGEIPADVAAQLISALSSQAKITEIDELIKRVELLERKH